MYLVTLLSLVAACSCKLIVEDSPRVIKLNLREGEKIAYFEEGLSSFILYSNQTTKVG